MSLYAFARVFLYLSFDKFWSYLIHIGPILYTSFLFGPHWSYLVHSIRFSPIQVIRSILSTLVLFSPHSSCSVHSIYFCPIQSTLVLFGPLWSYLVQFGPNLDYIQFLKLLVFTHCIIIPKTQKGLQFEPSNSKYMSQIPLTSPTMPLSSWHKTTNIQLLTYQCIFCKTFYTWQSSWVRPLQNITNTIR